MLRVRCYAMITKPENKLKMLILPCEIQKFHMVIRKHAICNAMKIYFRLGSYIKVNEII